MLTMDFDANRSLLALVDFRLCFALGQTGSRISGKQFRRELTLRAN
jgi:hypothetical protein